MGADVLGPKQLGEPVRAAGPDRAGRTQMSGDDRRRLVGEDVAHGGGEAGESCVELGRDLISQVDVLPHQVAAVAGQEPERDVDLIEHRLDQAEAINGGPLDGQEVGVVGLVAGVGREAKLLGGQRMDDAGLQPGGDGGCA